MLYQREGPTASVLVYVSDPNPQHRVRTLSINARANASDAPPDLATQVLLAQLPAPHRPAHGPTCSSSAGGAA